jgi:acyl-CoA thioesterase-1
VDIFEFDDFFCHGIPAPVEYLVVLYTGERMKGWRMNCSPIWKSLVAFASLAGLLCAASLQNAAMAAPGDKEIVIVAFGDSLTAGYQLPPEAAFPVQLEKALKAKGHNVRVVNSGVSGDTASDGLARLDWAMPEDADAVIVELGANDSLRGTNIFQTMNALDEILRRLKERKLEILLAGMEAPRNWGDQYVEDFRAMFDSLADKHSTLIYPFFLHGVALDSSLSLDDGLHPNEKGVAKIVENIVPRVEDLIERVKKKQSKDS